MIDISDLHSYFPLFLFFTSVIISLIVTPIVSKIATVKHMVVKPNARTSHEGEIPNIGGIAIFLATIISVLLFCSWRTASINFVLLGASLILATGFIDDILRIQPYQKMIGQFVALFSLIVMGNIRIESFHGIFWINELPLCTIGIYEVPLWSYLFSFFAAIVIINSINLIDGIDGLASGMVAVLSLFVGAYFYHSNATEVAFIAFALSGALWVFFCYNVFGKSTKLFMGDSGSLLCGFFVAYFLFSFLDINLGSSEFRADYPFSSVPAIAISSIAVPLFDTLRVFIFRAMKKQSPLRADKNHIHHHLINLLGIKHHLKASSIMVGANVLFLLIALLLSSYKLSNLLIIALNFAIALILMQLLLFFEKRKKRAESNE